MRDTQLMKQAMLIEVLENKMKKLTLRNKNMFLPRQSEQADDHFVSQEYEESRVDQEKLVNGSDTF